MYKKKMNERGVRNVSSPASAMIRMCGRGVVCTVCMCYAIVVEMGNVACMRAGKESTRKRETKEWINLNVSKLYPH